MPNSKTQPIHEIMPELLKKLSYPGTVSKSHFQTLGGPSFGNVLGVFHFLLVQAKTVVAVENNYNIHFFPNRDNEGFEMDPNKPSKQELEYNYFTGVYKEYHKGSTTDSILGLIKSDFGFFRQGRVSRTLARILGKLFRSSGSR